MGIVIPHFGDVATEAQRDYRTKVTQLISLGAGICALSTMYLVPLDRHGGDNCASLEGCSDKSHATSSEHSSQAGKDRGPRDALQRLVIRRTFLELCLAEN